MSETLVYQHRLPERWIDRIMVAAHATGRPDDRGAVTVRVSDYEGDAWASLSPSQAIELAAILSEYADKAARFSTRGFVGSTE